MKSKGEYKLKSETLLTLNPEAEASGSAAQKTLLKAKCYPESRPHIRTGSANVSTAHWNRKWLSEILTSSAHTELKSETLLTLISGSFRIRSRSFRIYPKSWIIPSRGLSQIVDDYSSGYLTGSFQRFHWEPGAHTSIPGSGERVWNLKTSNFVQ